MSVSRARATFGEGARADHRHAHVENDDRRSGDEVFVAIDLEVLHLHLYRGAGARPQDSVRDALADIDEEGIAELPQLRLGLLLARLTLVAQVVLAGAVLAQLGENVAQGALSQLAQRLGRELCVLVADVSQTFVFQELGHALQLFKHGAYFLPEEPFCQVLVHAAGVQLAQGLAELALELVVLAELLQHAHRVFEAEGGFAAEVESLAQGLASNRFDEAGHLGEIPAQAVVPQESVHRVLELLTLLW
jgi:hypothetical protein